MIDMYESFQYFPKKKAKFGFSLFISLAQTIRTPFAEHFVNWILPLALANIFKTALNFLETSVELNEA